MKQAKAIIIFELVIIESTILIGLIKPLYRKTSIKPDSSTKPEKKFDRKLIK